MYREGKQIIIICGPVDTGHPFYDEHRIINILDNKTVPSLIFFHQLFTVNEIFSLYIFINLLLIA